jgi:hypothetical protein
MHPDESYSKISDLSDDDFHVRFGHNDEKELTGQQLAMPSPRIAMTTEAGRPIILACLRIIEEIPASPSSTAQALT